MLKQTVDGLSLLNITGLISFLTYEYRYLKHKKDNMENVFGIEVRGVMYDRRIILGPRFDYEY